MKLILAQGNPGADYKATRHNVGFMALDSLAEDNGLSWSEKTKFMAYVAEGEIGGQKVILAKPTTFYNETGRSARAIIDFYKLDSAEDLLVVHDDLALPFGTIRLRQEGSDAGNNGVKSLLTHVGPTFCRIRIGIWNEYRDRVDDTDFVLAKFNSKETAALKGIFDEVKTDVAKFVAGEGFAAHTKRI